MKKILAFILVFAMLVSVAIMPAYATEIDSAIYPITTDATEITIDGIAYKVIRTADDFVQMTGNANYILAGNIDLGTVSDTAKVTDGEYVVSTEKTGVVNGWSGVLEGNRYSVYNYKVTAINAGLFNLAEVHSVSIRNLNIGTPDNMVNVTVTKNNSSAVCGYVATGSSLNCENVNLYVNLSASWVVGGFAGFLEKGTATSFINCTVYGNLKGSGKMGGFVGNAWDSDTFLTFINCDCQATITAGNTSMCGDYYGAAVGSGSGSVVVVENDVEIPTVTVNESGLYDIPDDAKYVSMNGSYYTVVRDSADFLSMRGFANYVLVNDIDLNATTVSASGSFVVSKWSGILEGNGHAVTNYIVTSPVTGLFDLYSVARTIAVRNLDIGTSAAPISVTNTAATGNHIGALCGQVSNGSVLNCENVDLYIDANVSCFVVGGYIGWLESGNVSFVDCSVNGIIKCQKRKVGGFIGAVSEADDVRFTDCVVADSIVVNIPQDDFNGLYVGGGSDSQIIGTVTTSFGSVDKDADAILGANMTIGTTLDMNYYALIADSNSMAQMKFTVNGEEYFVDGVKNGYYYHEYKFTLEEIAPQCMGDNIKAELVVNGETVVTKESYSVETYLNSLANKNQNDTKLLTLIEDMLDYGAAAQKYVGHKNNDLVSDGVTDDEWTDLTADADMTLVSADGLGGTKFTAMNAWFDNVNKLYVKYTVAEGDAATVAINGTVVTGTLVDGTENTYIVYTDAISAVNFTDDYLFTLTVGDVVMQTLTCSIESYVYAMQNDATIGELVKALYNYGMSAEAYNA